MLPTRVFFPAVLSLWEAQPEETLLPPDSPLTWDAGHIHTGQVRVPASPQPPPPTDPPSVCPLLRCLIRGDQRESLCCEHRLDVGVDESKRPEGAGSITCSLMTGERRSNRWGDKWERAAGGLAITDVLGSLGATPQIWLTCWPLLSPESRRTMVKILAWHHYSEN